MRWGRVQQASIPKEWVDLTSVLLSNTHTILFRLHCQIWKRFGFLFVELKRTEGNGAMLSLLSALIAEIKKFDYDRVSFHFQSCV